MSKMTAAERTDLRSLIRQRGKLMKAHVAQRGLELMADFERQLQTYFSFDQDEVWEAAYSEAEKAAGSQGPNRRHGSRRQDCNRTVLRRISNRVDLRRSHVRGREGVPRSTALG